MTTPAETNLLTAVRAFVQANPHRANPLALEIKEALDALDAERAAEPVTRRFLITYLYGAAGVVSARAFATTIGPVTETTVRNWENVVKATLPDGHCVALTSFTELEA
jgi:hypothetical protein